jgi:hypothetical protein
VSNTGMPGFDGAGLALGTVVGVRWWDLDLGSSGHAAPTLKGQRAVWQPGFNTAVCLGSAGHVARASPAARRILGFLDDQVTADHGPIPDPDCGCGFWAYWALEVLPMTQQMTCPVLGVIEGDEDSTIGDRGFRSARARIVALCPQFTITAPPPPDNLPARWSPPPGMFSRGDSGQSTFEALTSRDPTSRWVETPETLAAMAQLEDDLAGRYQVPVYTSVKWMLASHPLTTDYLPHPAACACEACEAKPERVLARLVAAARDVRQLSAAAGVAAAELDRLRDQLDLRLVVIAGSYSQFHAWCRDNLIDPRARNVIYAESECRVTQRLRGSSAPVHVEFAGTWSHRPDLRNIERAVSHIAATCRPDPLAGAAIPDLSGGSIPSTAIPDLSKTPRPPPPALPPAAAN